MEFLKDIFFAVMVTAIKVETNNLMTKIATLVIDKALYYVPAQSQERYAEEWKAHLNECPSSPGKLVHSVGCFYAARRIDPLLVVSSGLLIASAYIIVLSLIFRNLGDYYHGKSKLCLGLSRFTGRIGAKTLSQRLRRGGLAVSLMSFLSSNMYYCCRKFRYIPQSCPVGSSARDYHIHWKIRALVELWSTVHTATRYSGIPVIRALLGKATTKVSRPQLPEVLTLFSEVGMFPIKPLRIKRHYQLRRFL